MSRESAIKPLGKNGGWSSVGIPQGSCVIPTFAAIHDAGSDCYSNGSVASWRRKDNSQIFRIYLDICAVSCPEGLMAPKHRLYAKDVVGVEGVRYRSERTPQREDGWWILIHH